MDFSSFITFIPIAFTALFPVVNPVGSSVLFLNLTEGADSSLRRVVSWKIAANSLLLMVATLFLGIYILNIFGISIPVVQLCGGMVLFTIGWKELNASGDAGDASKRNVVKDDVDLGTRYKNQAFFPFTFPLTVGPGTIATTLTLSAEASKGSSGSNMGEYVGATLAMLMVSICIFLCYAYSDRLVNRLKPTSRTVLMRLLSFLLLCIGGQITVNGIRSIIATL